MFFKRIMLEPFPKFAFFLQLEMLCDWHDVWAGFYQSILRGNYTTITLKFNCDVIIGILCIIRYQPIMLAYNNSYQELISTKFDIYKLLLFSKASST